MNIEYQRGAAMVQAVRQATGVEVAFHTANTYRLVVGGRVHYAVALSALRACELAEERWGGWPTRIDKVTT